MLLVINALDDCKEGDGPAAIIAREIHRTLLRVVLTVLCSLNASRFSPRPNVQLCRDAEEDEWNVLMKFAILQHTLAARKGEKHHGISSHVP